MQNETISLSVTLHSHSDDAATTENVSRYTFVVWRVKEKATNGALCGLEEEKGPILLMKVRQGC